MIMMLVDVVPLPVVKDTVDTHIRFLEREENGTIITLAVLGGSSLRNLKEFTSSTRKKNLWQHH